MKQCGMTFFREDTRQEGEKIVRKRRVEENLDMQREKENRKRYMPCTQS